MLFRAVTDDSASDSGDRRLFMAGYILPSELWSGFSKSWVRALNRNPRIQYLKMAEAQNLRGQFRHWSVEEKDRKLKQLATVIRKYDPASFEFSVSRTAFDSIYKPVAPYGLGRPHFACVFGIISVVTRFIAEVKVPGLEVEFTFDRQDGVSSDIQLFFEYMCQTLPIDQQQLIKSAPLFEDDTQFVPLQAADMLTWHLRREHEDGSLSAINPIIRIIRGFHHYSMRLEASDLARWATHHRSEGTVPKTKPEWKSAMEYSRALIKSGFEIPHGTTQEIHQAHIEHLKKLHTNK